MMFHFPEAIERWLKVRFQGEDEQAFPDLGVDVRIEMISVQAAASVSPSPCTDFGTPFLNFARSWDGEIDYNYGYLLPPTSFSCFRAFTLLLWAPYFRYTLGRITSGATPPLQNHDSRSAE
jgi:hypothetical protein